MRIGIERIFEIQAELSKINEQYLSDIEFYEGGVKINIDKKILDKFGYTGLNNVDFITSGYYKQKP